MKVIPETRGVDLNLIYTFLLLSLGYTADGGQFISEGIIRSVVCAWFIRYNIIFI
jgi:hypothetical protein